MNICFYTSCEVSPTQGGTERITFTVAKNLIEKYGWKCYSIYSVKARTESVPELFEDTALINNPRKSHDKLLDILDNWNIDILINQGAFEEAYNIAVCGFETQSEEVADYSHIKYG